MTGAEPLAGYPVVRACQIEEFEYRLRNVYGATSFEAPNAQNKIDVRGNFVQLHDVAMGFNAFGTSVKIDFGESEFARLQIPLRGGGVTGSGKQSTEVAAGCPSLTSPGKPTVLQYGEGFEQLFLRVSSDALERKLAALSGRPVQRNLDFALSDFTSLPMLTGLVRMIERLIVHLDSPETQLSPLALKEMEQAIIVQLLVTSRHNMSVLIDEGVRDAAPDHVRRVESYIEAHWDQPLTIEKLVDISGVSARSLFKAFEKRRGCSPMAFAKRVRLERSHDMLSKPGDMTSVSDVALACGFLNLGHFARDYLNSFGELPSQTLTRSKTR